MPVPLRVDPILLGYGDTFGTYGGQTLNDTDVYDSAIGQNANENTFADTQEFTQFEQTIKDYILGSLGHPVVRVELTPFQLKLAIDEAISHLDYHAPFWATQMAVFRTDAGQNMYVLPNHIARNLTYVGYKKTLLTIQNAAGSLEFDYFIKYFQDNFLFSTFEVSEFYVLQMHLEMVRKVLGQEGSFDVINGNILQIQPTPVSNNQDVILVYRGLDANTIHPYYRNWIQRYGLAAAKGILGEIRGKYNTLPSPGGGASLNGAALTQASMQEKAMLKEELLNEIEEPPVFTMY